MFADLDEALRQLLIREVPLDNGSVDIAFERPDRDNVARFSRPTVNLFLFEAAENRELKQSGWRQAAGSGNGNGIARLAWPALRVDVRYLVTAWAAEVEDQHRLFYRVYRALHRVAEIGDDLADGALAGQEKAPGVSVEAVETKLYTDLWSVIDNSLTPGLVLKTTVAVDLNAVREAPFVRRSTLRVSPPGGAPESRTRLGGRVTDAAGEPIAGARVAVEGRLVQTDRDGRFTVSPVSESPASLTVEAEGFEKREQTVGPAAKYDIELAPAPEPAPQSGRRRGRGRQEET